MSSNYNVTTRAVSRGRSTSGAGSSVSYTGGAAAAAGGVTEHSGLSGRGLPEQHPMAAISGLTGILVPNSGGVSLKLVSPDGTKTRTISVDNSGNLCIDGNVVATGDVTAGQTA